MLFLLAAIWGASYLFIKVALEDIEPAPMMFIRALVAGARPARVPRAHDGRPAGRSTSSASSWRPALVLGAFNAAVPFWLVAWGEQHIDSSVAGIAQSTVPIFTFLLALHYLPHERVGATRVAGVALGFAGVAALAGLDPQGGWWAMAGTLAVVLASVSYAATGIYGQLRVRTVPGPVLATGSMLACTLYLLPLSLFQLPDHVPDAASIASLAALTLLGTAFAQLVLFRMLRLFGSRRLSLVTYLMPGFAVVYGADAARRAGHARRGRRPRADPGRSRARVRRPAAPRARGRAGGARVSVSIRRARARPTSTSSSSSSRTRTSSRFSQPSGPRIASRCSPRSSASEAEPDAFGVFVVEVDGARAGTMQFERANRRSRIADLGGLAIHPGFRGRRVADEAARLFQQHLIRELGFHRLQMEIYGFNERAMAHAERAGFTREGVRRKAYWRNGEWVDGVLFGLVAEDL